MIQHYSTTDQILANVNGVYMLVSRNGITTVAAYEML